MSIEQDIKDAVAKHLPQTLGEELQKRLKRADEDALKLKSTEDHASLIAKELSAANAKITELEQRLGRHLALSEREQAVVERERNAEIADLKFKLESANSNTQFARDVALGLVRNAEYRETVHQSASRSDPVVQNGYIQSAAGSSSETATKTTQQA